MIQHKFRVAELKADLRVLPDIEHDTQRALELGLCEAGGNVHERSAGVGGASKDEGNIAAERGAGRDVAGP